MQRWARVRLSEAARAALLTHRWPSDVLELQNAIERALIVSDGMLITAEQRGTRGAVVHRELRSIAAVTGGVA